MKAGVLMKLGYMLVCCALLFSGTAMAKEAAPMAADLEVEKRMVAISEELRCLVCQNQSLADSHADLAIDLKNQVREQLPGTAPALLRSARLLTGAAHDAAADPQPGQLLHRAAVVADRQVHGQPSAAAPWRRSAWLMLLASLGAVDPDAQQAIEVLLDRARAMLWRMAGPK